MTHSSTEIETEKSVKEQVENLFLPVDAKSRLELWRENSGSRLLAFAFLVFLIGSGFLLYRQKQESPSSYVVDPKELVNESAPMHDAVDLKETIGLVVIGAANDEGQMRIAIYDSTETFDQLPKAIFRFSTHLHLGESRVNLPAEEMPEKFAITVFHDEDSNGVINKNRLGFPSERYGFSNGARGATNSPTFEDTVIDRPEVGESISISIR